MTGSLHSLSRGLCVTGAAVVEAGCVRGGVCSVVEAEVAGAVVPSPPGPKSEQEASDRSIEARTTTRRASIRNFVFIGISPK
jgi:hypothetical protein